VIHITRLCLPMCHSDSRSQHLPDKSPIMSSQSAFSRLLRPAVISLCVWLIEEALLILAPRTPSPWPYHAVAFLLLAAIVVTIDRNH
jgi:hypothetical protein